MALIDAKQSLAQEVYCATRTGTSSSAAVTDGVTQRNDSLFKSSATAGTTIASVDTGTTGVKHTHVFKYRFPFTVTAAIRVMCKLKWEVTVAGPATTTGRFNLDVQDSGVAIGSLTKASGATVATSATTTNTDKLLIVDVPNRTWDAGDTLDLRYEFDVVAAAAGTTLNVKLHHDPDTAGNELIVGFVAL